jgi:threonine synthase
MLPRSFCEECFSPLEVAYDYEALKSIAAKEKLSKRDFNMWRYAEFLPLPEAFLFRMPLVGLLWWLRSTWQKDGACGICTSRIDAVCFPSLLSRTAWWRRRWQPLGDLGSRRWLFFHRKSGERGCGAIGAAGLRSLRLYPADLEPAKILNTAVYGARIVRINGNYDHVNRLCARLPTASSGTGQREFAALLREGSKTHGFEIAEQLGWKLPDNVVVPMAGGSLITKIAKAFRELVTLGWVEEKPVKVFWRAGYGLLADFDGCETRLARFEPQKARHHCAVAGHWQSGGWAVRHQADSRFGGWADDTSDRESRGSHSTAGGDGRNFCGDGRWRDCRRDAKTDS